jgi:hypothetical protein
MSKPTTRADLLEELQAIRTRIRTIEGDLPIVAAAAAEAVASARLAAIDHAQGVAADVGEAEERARRAVDRESRLRAELATLIARESGTSHLVDVLTPPAPTAEVPLSTLLRRREGDLRKRLIDAVAELLILEHEIKGKRTGTADLSAIVPKFCGGPASILGAMSRVRAEICKEARSHE